ncbi:MAG: fibrobacter succinogenes major paralogous domain-containing protein [Bacteroidales bacterium]|nr:fibrobacter succinogenes major paralogous domain-containing protein [Bacteroidales bacterium]
MKKTLIYVFVCVLISLGLSSCHKEKSAEENIIRDAVTDVDGHKYDAVRIGNQVWMAENLRTTKYADGTEIPLDTVVVPSRYYPDNNAANVEKYGYLYNWEAVMNGELDTLHGRVQGICPTGWHVPSDVEWQELLDYVWTQVNPNKAYDKPAKALASTEGWLPSSNDGSPGCDPSKNNSTGFSALPAGIAVISDENIILEISYMGHYAYFWSSDYDIVSEQFYYGKSWWLDNMDSELRNEMLMGAGSVRCLRD